MAKKSLEDAILLATRLHQGQVDKQGEPYILHPIRVMLKFQDRKAQIVAVLHDVLEDCNVSPEDLLEIGYEPEIIEALNALRKTGGTESYEDYIQRIWMGPVLARQVKIADLEDNTDPRRCPHPTDQDKARTAKYLRALEVLNSLAPQSKPSASGERHV